MIIFFLDTATFFGRFHPLFVHLPIGFLILAIVLEWFQRKQESNWSHLIPLAWLFGALSAAAAALCGWLLAENGGYSGGSLDLHRWFGIGLVVISFAGWWIKRNPKQLSKKIHLTVNIGVIALLTLVGHWGGNLTHGETFLVEHAPKPIKNLIAKNEVETELPDLNAKDSIMVYEDMVQPILANKCMACHNNEVQRGGLNMADPDVLMQGGDTGPVLAANDAYESELFKRVTLPQSSEKFMPTKGEPFSYDEIKLLEWWIDSGAVFQKNLKQLEVDEGMQQVILRVFDVDTRPRPWYETVKLGPLDESLLVDLEKKGFLVKLFPGDSPLLDVKYQGEQLTPELLKILENVKEHIIWLSLGNANLSDEQLKTLATFENLNRLELHKNPISDDGITHLAALQHLESLNLYATGVTDIGIKNLKKMKGLKRIYLWQTQVSETSVAMLQEEIPGLEIISGAGSL